MSQLCSSSCALIQKEEHLPIFLFYPHYRFPTECKMNCSIAREGSNHLVFVNPTIDHPGICPLHPTIASFHSLFHFQSFSAARFISVLYCCHFSFSYHVVDVISHFRMCDRYACWHSTFKNDFKCITNHVYFDQHL